MDSHQRGQPIVTPGRSFVPISAVDLAEHNVGAASALSDRQAEAATAAVDCGYYGTPRERSVADVADRPDWALGTAAEHRWKAEATLVGCAVEGSRGDLRDAPRSETKHR